MPIYEYKCDDCGSVSDILIKNRAHVSPITCPTCQSGKMSKLISVPGTMVSKGGADFAPPPACPNQGCCNSHSCPTFQE
jgi:putative FmdB family regulatory protein